MTLETPKTYVHAEDASQFNEGYTAYASMRGSLAQQDGNTTGRVGFNRRDYEDQRPCESIPTKHHDIMMKVDDVYNRLGLVRNIIDLMTDFTIQGIRVVHKNRRVEKFYQNWFNRVCGIDRSERFASSFYKYGNVIIKRRWATLTKSDKKKIYKTAASDDLNIEHIKTTARRIPIRYVCLNPATVDVLGGELAQFVGGKLRYGLRVPYSIMANTSVRMNAVSTQEDAAIIKELMDQIPSDIKEAIQEGASRTVPFKGDILVYHYKKEDWDLWAKPIMYGVLTDINVLDKLKLADLTALEGATNRIRVFKLGNLEYKLAPTEGAFSLLSDLLQVNPGGGTRDIVWGPDLEMIESKTDSYQFLGEEKYKPTLSSIFAGLGIPPSLTGTSDIGGTTNNLVSLKALIKRLEYGRGKLLDFWNGEFEIVRQVMGFRESAAIEFDQNNLGDEEAEKKLYIDMADRDIIPYEVVQKKFGLHPEINTKKTTDEYKERRRKQRPPKADPFHDGNYEKGIKKSLIDRGKVEPSEVGVDLDLKKDGENINIDNQGSTNTATKPKPKGGTVGRPANTKDIAPRKKRRFVPVVKAKEIWAASAQEKIAELVNPAILAKYNKKNMRSLTDEQTQASEKLKFHILYSHEAFTEITQESVKQAATEPFPKKAYNYYQKAAKETQQLLGRELTFAELHDIQIGVYVNVKN